MEVPVIIIVLAVGVSYGSCVPAPFLGDQDEDLQTSEAFLSDKLSSDNKLGAEEGNQTALEPREVSSDWKDLILSYRPCDDSVLVCFLDSDGLLPAVARLILFRANLISAITKQFLKSDGGVLFFVWAISTLLTSM